MTFLVFCLWCCFLLFVTHCSSFVFAGGLLLFVILFAFVCHVVCDNVCDIILYDILYDIVFFCYMVSCIWLLFVVCSCLSVVLLSNLPVPGV